MNMRVWRVSVTGEDAAASLASRSSRSSSVSSWARLMDEAAACFIAERSKVESPSSFASGEGWLARSRTARKAAKSAAVWYVPAPCLVALGYLCCDPTAAAPVHRDDDVLAPAVDGSGRVCCWCWCWCCWCQPGLPRTGRWEVTGGLVTTVVRGSSPAKSICTRGPGVRNGAPPLFVAPAAPSPAVPPFRS